MEVLDAESAVRYFGPGIDGIAKALKKEVDVVFVDLTRPADEWDNPEIIKTTFLKGIGEVKIVPQSKLFVRTEQSKQIKKDLESIGFKVKEESSKVSGASALIVNRGLEIYFILLSIPLSLNSQGALQETDSPFFIFTNETSFFPFLI